MTGNELWTNRGPHRRAGWAAAAACIAAFALALPSAALADPTFTGTEGHPTGGNLGTTASEPCPTDQETGNHVCAQLSPSGTIDWGDNSGTSAATFTRQCASNASTCTFVVSGTHTYEAAGNYTGTVNWSDSGSGTTHSGSFNFTAGIADADLSISGASIGRSQNSATLTATLTDGNPHAQPCDYEVDIDWGDGQTSFGTVNNQSCQIFRSHIAPKPTSVSYPIQGTHTYDDSHPITSDQATVTVLDHNGGAHTSAQVDIPLPPDTHTQAATDVGQTTATLAGNADPSGGTVQDCHFAWGPTTDYGNTAPCSPSTFTANTPVTAAISGLTPGTKYYFELFLTTNVGTKAGGQMNFTTLAPVAQGAPTVVTGVADAVDKTGATLHGFVTPTGPMLSDCHFEWGTDTSYGNTVPCDARPSGTTATPVAGALTGLTPDTTYHFRIVASYDGVPPSVGADATFTTDPTCAVEATFGYIDAKGCLSHTGNLYHSTPGTPIQLNGMTLTPDAPTTTITFDGSKGTITASGKVTVLAGLVTLLDARFDWTEPDPGSAASVKIGTLTPPSSSKIAGISFNGALALSFNKQKGTDITGNVQLPFASLAKLAGINGTVELHTAPGKGLLDDQLKITRDPFELYGIGVKNLKVTYTPSTDTWEGGADITLPTPNKVSISADLAFQHGEFHKFSGSADNLNAPIIGPITLQKISVIFGVNPTTIGGALGVAFGPQVDGKQLARVDGNFIYQAASAGVDGFIKVNGQLTLLTFKVADAYFDYFTSGLTKFGGHLMLGLPDETSDDPTNQPVYIDTGIDGAIQGSKFDVDAKADVKLNFIDLDVGAEILVSDKGLVACASVSAFGFTWNPGVGYTWATHAFDPMFDGCSVGPYKTLDLGASTRAAGTSPRITLPSSGALVELQGATAQPQVTLTGPGGQHVTVPVDSTAPLEVAGFMVFQDPGDKKTWIAVQHGGGQWTVADEPGSSAITTVRVAPLLPQPKISARVTGAGSHRVLHWTLRQIPGQRVTFWEKGTSVAHVIGSTTAAHGSLRFSPAVANGRARSIEAQVTSNGHSRADITVAHFTAPAHALAGRAGHVKVKAARGGGIRITWSPAARANQYLLTIAANGGHVVELATGRTHSLVVRDVKPIRSATVTVLAERADGVPGPPVTVRFRARRRTG